jgi:hypothetical protein
MPRQAGPSADLRLPGLLARVVWPGDDAPARPPVLVLLVNPDAAEDVHRTLGAMRGVISMIVPSRAADGVAASEWIADHAAELGADPDRVIVATVA